MGVAPAIAVAWFYPAPLAGNCSAVASWLLDQLYADPEDLKEDRQAFSATAADLRRSIAKALLPCVCKCREQLRHRPLIREQAFAEALPVFQLEKLSRYEVFLDRKLERTLAMLLKLKELRQSAETA